MIMSDYQLPSLDTFSKRSVVAPLGRDEYQALSSVSHKPQPNGSDKVEISSAAGRQSMLAALKQKFAYQPTQATLIGGLTPSPSSGYSSGLYAGVGQFSPTQMESFINSYL